MCLGGLLGTVPVGYLDSLALRGFQADVLGQTLAPVDTNFMAAGMVILLGGIYAGISLRGVVVGNRKAGAAPGD